MRVWYEALNWTFVLLFYGSTLRAIALYRQW